MTVVMIVSFSDKVCSDISQESVLGLLFPFFKIYNLSCAESSFVKFVDATKLINKD